MIRESREDLRTPGASPFSKDGKAFFDQRNHHPGVNGARRVGMSCQFGVMFTEPA
jgi:hypothetical protein